jgi:hypothetical protein
VKKRLSYSYMTSAASFTVRNSTRTVCRHMFSCKLKEMILLKYGNSKFSKNKPVKFNVPNFRFYFVITDTSVSIKHSPRGRENE